GGLSGRRHPARRGTGALPDQVRRGAGGAGRRHRERSVARDAERFPEPVLARQTGQPHQLLVPDHVRRYGPPAALDGLFPRHRLIQNPRARRACRRVTGGFRFFVRETRVFYLFLAIIAVLGIGIYLLFILPNVPGAVEERLGVLEPLPEDLGRWKTDQESPEGQAALARGQTREIR